MDQKYSYLWIRVPKEVHDAWKKYIPRRVREEISRKVSEMVLEYAKKFERGE